MGKLIDSTGKKILLGTVLYNGDKTSNFTLNDDYINYDEYKNKKEYIAEVQSINHLAEEDSIRAGQTLIVPYYSYDFVK